MHRYNDGALTTCGDVVAKGPSGLVSGKPALTGGSLPIRDNGLGGPASLIFQGLYTHLNADEPDIAGGAHRASIHPVWSGRTIYR
ncbi:MAG TPA: hypothetical protein VMW38_28825 [Terriglobia bacterium]|nr:hypothetical protein [Terriglobia bacterium]